MKFKFEHREAKREDGRVRAGQIGQVCYLLSEDCLGEEIEMIKVTIECDGPSDIRPAHVKGHSPAIGIFGDVDGGIIRMSNFNINGNVINLPIKVMVNPHRREPWLYVIFYHTDGIYYDPLEKEVDGNNITYTVRVWKR